MKNLRDTYNFLLNLNEGDLIQTNDGKKLKVVSSTRIAVNYIDEKENDCSIAPYILAKREPRLVVNNKKQTTTKAKRIRKGTYKLELEGVKFMIRKEGSLGWTVTGEGYYKGHSLDEAHEKDTTKKGCVERAVNMANNLKDNPSAYSYWVRALKQSVMINLHEKIKLALKTQGKSFAFLEQEINGKTTNNLSNSIKNNKSTIPLLEQILEVLGLDIVPRKEISDYRKIKAIIEGNCDNK